MDYTVEQSDNETNDAYSLFSSAGFRLKRNRDQLEVQVTEKSVKTMLPAWSWSPPLPSTNSPNQDEAIVPSLRAIALERESIADGAELGTQSVAPVQAFVGQGVLVRGDVSFTNLLRVEGAIRGDIAGGRILVLLNGAKVEGDLIADEIIILDAEVIGCVRGRQLVELSSDAKVQGDVKAPRVRINKGAALSGECILTHE